LTPPPGQPLQWDDLAPSNRSRDYHSTSTLLPDGRVLAAGGEIDIKNVEIYSPPYLFTGTEKPIVGQAPRITNYDTVIDVRLGQNPTGQEPAPDAYDIAEVNLIRLGAITHSFDQNQRFVSLNFSVESAGTLNVTTPLNGNYAPPGDYMMFLISDAGAPSKAHFIRLDPDV